MLSVLLDVSAIFNNVVAPPTCVANLGWPISSFVLLFRFYFISLFTQSLLLNV
jgi:hypothetical protein